MLQGPQVKRALARAAQMIGVAAGYYGYAYIGTLLAVPPSGFAILWIATAFLLGVMLQTPVRSWWVVLGIVPTHFYLISDFGTPFGVALTQVGGNLFVAGASALVVRRVLGAPLQLDQFRVVVSYMVVAGVAMPAIGNMVVLSIHGLTGWAEDLWLSWRQWMLACIVPTLTVPLVMQLALQRKLVGYGEKTRDLYIELAIVSILLFALSYVAFGLEPGGDWQPVVMLLPVPLMLWASVRLGLGGACLSMLVFAAAIIVRALSGVGPFADQASAVSLMSLQVFLIVITIMLMLLAALMQEWRNNEELLKRSESRMEVVAASTDTGLWQWDEVKQQLWMTEHCRAMFGLAPSQTLTPELFLNIVHPDDRAHLRGGLRWMVAAPDMATIKEFRIVRPDGEARWFIVRTHTEFDREGNAVRISGVFRDVTPRMRALEEAQRLGDRLITLQEEERQSIAQDLHDLTAQHLVAANLSLGMLTRRVTMNEAADSVMEDIRASLTLAINELRTFTYLLRPVGLDSEGITSVLRRYVDGFARRTGIQATFRASAAADRLPLDQQRALLRIVQESLMNVHRHAQAKRVLITLRCVREDLHLIVSDDGKGIRQRAVRSSDPARLGVGIPGMTARVRHLGGKITIRSSAKGTVVHVAIPIAPELRRGPLISPALEKIAQP